MKTFIIGLFGLTLLSSSVAWAAQQQPNYPTTPASIPNLGSSGQSGNAVCATYNGIFFVVVNRHGNVEAFHCDRVGGKQITKKTQLPLDKSWTEVVEVNLGTVKKFKASDETDPCVWWNIGGSSYVFCW